MAMRWPILLALVVAGCGDEAYDLDGGDQIPVGRAYVAERGCPACHQSPNAADGILSGQTTARAGTLVYPANLTPDSATGLGDWADLEIIRAMRAGVDNQQLPLCPPMPRFDGSDAKEPAMTDLEANAIVAYLRSLPAVARAIPASQCALKTPPDLAVHD